MRAAGKWFGAAVLMLALVTSGCESWQSKMSDKAKTRAGLPNPRWQVGGGLSIDYTAPDDGMVYVVDLNSNRFLVTESVGAGDNFTFAPTSEAEFQFLGLDPAAAKIALYFVPAAVFRNAPKLMENK
ncbi:MAG: hypothetical protein LLF76_11425 [Planctomycetaceae bacterium]|nr:hypothetical protein [Planctomycetaceae bacterium]